MNVNVKPQLWEKAPRLDCINSTMASRPEPAGTELKIIRVRANIDLSGETMLKPIYGRNRMVIAE
jgi:hypothetical protein